MFEGPDGLGAIAMISCFVDGVAANTPAWAIRPPGPNSEKITVAEKGVIESSFAKPVCSGVADWPNSPGDMKTVVWPAASWN